MLAQNENLSEEASVLTAIFDAHAEWLLSDKNDFAVRRDEIEIAARGNHFVLSCLTAEGWRNWRVLEWKRKGECVVFSIMRKFGAEKAEIEFSPRVSVAELIADVRAARNLRANKIAEIARREFSRAAKIERVSLNTAKRRGRVGNFARILISNQTGKTIAVSGSVLEKTASAKLLAQALLWLAKMEERRQIAELWLVVETASNDELTKLCALMRAAWREKIKIYERKLEEKFCLENAETQETRETLTPVQMPLLNDLWSEKAKKTIRPKFSELSETAQKIIESVPDAIDVVRSRAGETVRFFGLPFLRTRRVFGAETIWFGVENKKKRILDGRSLSDFEKLFADLCEHRRAEVADRSNYLYRAAPESWLETILRRNVSALDPNLRLAPLHAQFRVANRSGALDLLAIRSDGRLVVIELKTAPDREIVFQAADYWRQIETQRRSGNLQKAGWFEDLEIADEPALVYLVAPLMSFHREFDFLANILTAEIEIWRFDLNEDWRTQIRVARRERVN